MGPAWGAKRLALMGTRWTLRLGARLAGAAEEADKLRWRLNAAQGAAARRIPNGTCMTLCRCASPCACAVVRRAFRRRIGAGEQGRGPHAQRRHAICHTRGGCRTPVCRISRAVYLTLQYQCYRMRISAFSYFACSCYNCGLAAAATRYVHPASVKTINCVTSDVTMP